MTALKGYLVLDIETTVGALHGRKASPFHPDNWIVAVGYKAQGGEVQGHYYAKPGQSTGWLAQALSDRPRFLVGFNIGFDLLHLLRDPMDYAAYQKWVAEGGELWDCQLAEYLLDGQRQESHMLSLDEVAIRYGGNVKIDEVKALWSQGVDTPDIPKQLLMDYLVGRGEDHGDIGNTELVFLGQVKAAKKGGYAKSIQLNNGALLATIEMKRNGLFVNVEKGRAQAQRLAAKVAELKHELVEFLPDDLPFEFNWGSRRQLSAFIFGGRVPYEERVHTLDDDGLPAYAKKDAPAYTLVGGGYTLLPPGSPGMADEAYERYSAGKKKGWVKTKKVKVNDPNRPKLRWETFHYTFPQMTKPDPKWEGAEKGVYSTAGEVIEELGSRGIPFLSRFSELADIVKDLGTYYIQEEKDAEGNVTKAKGMLTLVGDDGIVHGDISMVSTVTGRFAHSKPNTGNLPRADTSRVKEMFESRWGADGAILSSDFTSLEVYCQAVLAGDKQLIADLRQGLDMHIKRLSQVYDKPYEELVQLIKVQEDAEWKLRRTHIKTYSFQKAYGAGAAKIAAFLKLPVETVEEWMEVDDQVYPGIPAFFEKVKAAVNQSRVPTSKYAQHPTLRIPLQLGVGFYRTFDGKKYTFQEYPAPDFLAKKGTLQTFTPTELKNYPVQGLGGEWMKAAMWLAVRTLYRYRNLEGQALLVSTVHDALYIDAHESVRYKAGVILHASMLAASEFIEYWFGKAIPVAVPSETHWGRSMFEEHHFENHEEFHEKAGKVRQWLRKTYMNGHSPSFE